MSAGISAVRYCASEKAAERAVAVLEAIIDGVRNSNQAAENAAVKAAHAGELYEALDALVGEQGICAPEQDCRQCKAALAALSKARGETPKAEDAKQVSAWQSGPWTIIHTRAGIGETTVSLTPNEVAVLADQMFPRLLSQIEEICDRYGEDPDATDDQDAVARGIWLDIEELFAEKSA